MKLSGARLLPVLPQLPRDPASGAARSTRTMCEILAATGASIQAVATAASEALAREEPAAFLRQLGIQAVVHRNSTVNSTAYCAKFVPDIVLGFGGLPGDLRRYDRARNQGARIIFSLRNYGYNGAGDLLSAMDGIPTPSRFLTDFYRNLLGVVSTPLPLPIDLEGVVTSERDPIFFTTINPAPEKGPVVKARFGGGDGRATPGYPVINCGVARFAGQFGMGRARRGIRSAPSWKVNYVADACAAS